MFDNDVLVERLYYPEILAHARATLPQMIISTYLLTWCGDPDYV